MKFFKSNLKVIISFVLGVILASGITVYASSYFAKDITYTENKTVEQALNELYSNIGINRKLSELKPGSNTISNNTKETLYVALIGVTSASGAADIVNSRTQIKNVVGADIQEIFYSFESESNVGIRLYKLTNCEETISIESNVHTSGNGKIIFFGN